MKLACTVTMVSLACEQALLFGRGSRERASEGPLLVPIWSPWEPNLSHGRRGCQLGLLSINFVFRNVIFQPMVFPFRLSEVQMKFYERLLQGLLSSAPRSFAARSRVLARLASLAQIGELQCMHNLYLLNRNSKISRNSFHRFLWNFVQQKTFIQRIGSVKHFKRKSRTGLKLKALWRHCDRPKNNTTMKFSLNVIHMS